MPLCKAPRQSWLFLSIALFIVFEFLLVQQSQLMGAGHEVQPIQWKTETRLGDKVNRPVQQDNKISSSKLPSGAAGSKDKSKGKELGKGQNSDWSEWSPVGIGDSHNYRSGRLKPNMTGYPITRLNDWYKKTLPNLFLQFDWMYHYVARWCAKSGDDPVLVWVQSRERPLRHIYHDLTRLNISRKGNRILVCAGKDDLLSEVWPFLEPVTPWFNHIFFEAMDVERPGVRPMPIGLTKAYLDQMNETALYQLAESDPPKTNEVMSSFGAFWPNLTQDIPSRRDSAKFCQRHAGEPWLHCGIVDKMQYYSKLSSFKFMLYPAGRGVQSPKWLEAMMVGTIPVCRKGDASHFAFQSLISSGWPMVCVDDWEELADPAKREDWWRKLGPVLAQLRRMGGLTNKGYICYLLSSLRSDGPSVKYSLNSDCGSLIDQRKEGWLVLKA